MRAACEKVRTTTSPNRSTSRADRAIFETASAPDLLLDTERVIVQANNAASIQRGRSAPQNPFKDLIVEEEQPKFQVSFRGAVEGSEIPIFETHCRPPKGKILPFDVDMGPVDLNGRRMLLLCLRDIRRRMAVETRPDRIFRHIGDSVFITDSKGVIMLSSQSPYDLLGISYDAVI